MRERLGVPGVLLALLVVGVGLFANVGTAAADSMTTLASFSDPRTAMPARPGHIIKRARYGPFNVPANGQLHNQFKTNTAAPCTNCWVTDIVPSLVYESDPNNANGTVANLNNNMMAHHFVLLNPPPRADTVCPGGLQGMFGERFFAAGNERSQLHLPAPYGYFNGSNTNWTLIYHLVNKANVAKNVSIELVYQYRTAGGENATPLWLDIDGCGDSEYPAPTGYSDTHSNWVSTVSGRVIAANGHLHDVDITNASPCADHCPALGHGIAVSAEVVGGPAGDYYGPVPPNNSPPADLTGATLCRSEGFYGTSWAVAGGNRWKGHLDTMSSCGIPSAVSPTAQAQAFPDGGEYTFEGYPLNAGETVRLHTEYQNNTGAIQNDVMGIMIAYLVPREAAYPRPNSALKMQSALVPAFNECTTGAANRQHGPPLASPSCNPPALTSSQLTVGSTSNGVAAMKVVPGNTSTSADEADVSYTMSLTDVKCKAVSGGCAAAGADYTGQLQLRTTLRVTDRYNGPGEVGVVQDTPFNVTVPCTATGGAAGSSCAVTTSADAVLSGTVKENRRAIWQLDQVKVFDGGSDGVVSTNPNTLFAVQGVFAP